MTQTHVHRNRLISESPEGAKRYRACLQSFHETMTGMSALIDEPIIYPVKSLGGITVQSARISRYGLGTHDGLVQNHCAMLVTPAKGVHQSAQYNAERFSLRQEPLLSLVEVSYDERVQTLTFHGPGVDPLPINVADLRCTGMEDDVAVKMSTKHPVMPGKLETLHLTPWLRKFLHSNVVSPRYDIDGVSVVLTTREFHREVFEPIAGRQGVEMLYDDEAPILLTSSETLAWMNAALREQYAGFAEISMAAFRPNIVLRNLSPNAEDVAERFLFVGGSAQPQFICGALCTRCSVICLDPATGAKNGAEPTRWLVNNRPPRLDDTPGATFGVYGSFASCDVGKLITAGNAASVLQEKP